MAITEEQRREALRRRTQQAGHDRDKTGFSRMVLNLSNVENVELYKPKSSRDINCIDILPYIITQEWYKELRKPNGVPTGLEVGFTDYKLEVPVLFQRYYELIRP